MSGGLLRRRGFDIWLRGAQKNGPLCVRPGRGGAGRASPAETRVPDGAGGAGAAAAGVPSGRRVPVVQPGQAARRLGRWKCRVAVRGCMRAWVHGGGGHGWMGRQMEEGLMDSWMERRIDGCNDGKMDERIRDSCAASVRRGARAGLEARRGRLYGCRSPIVKPVRQ